MNIYTFLSKKLGIDTIDSSFYSLIDSWDSWYRSNVSHFHRYNIYNGQNKIMCRRLSLGMAAQVSSDMADLLMNERVKITINDETTSIFVDAVLERNKWQYKSNEYQELKAALGTVAYVVQVDGAAVYDDEHIEGGNIRIDYVRASNIFPVSWDNGIIHECVFRFRKTYKGKVYYHLQIHKKENGLYVVENHVVRDTSGSGTEIPPEKWSDYTPFQNMAPKIATGSEYPLFIIDKLNIANNFGDDNENPMGMSIFYNSLSVLQSIDLKYDSYANEFSLGKKRLFVAPEIAENKNGDAMFDENDVVFYILPEDTLEKNDAIHEVNMELRVDEHSKAIQDDLNLLSLKCGFGQNRYKFDRGTIQTATQVISEDSDMYRTVCKHELVLDEAIKELVRTIARIGTAIGVKELKPDAEIAIDFDDSIIEDKDSERTSDRADVAMGAMSLVEYRMKWYGETEEQAKKKVVENGDVIE